MSSSVETSLFSTARLAPGDRFSAWRDSINVVFESRLPDTLDPGHFNARVESVLLDGIMFTRCTTGAQKFDRPVSRILADGIDHYMFQLFEAGQVDIQVGRRALRGPRGAIVSFDLGDVLDSVNDDFDVLTVMVPRTRLAPRLIHPEAVQGLVVDSTQGAGRLLADFLKTLYAVGGGMEQAEAVAAGRALIELLAAAFNAVPVDLSDPPDWADQALQMQARKLIVDHLGDPDLDAHTLAGLMGLSRTRLYSLFAEAGGVMQVVRELRLKRSLTDLIAASNAHLQISQIAYRWGYRGLAQFNRAFKARFGVTPGEARAQGLRHTRQRNMLMSLPVGDRRYETWIETLA